MINSEESKREYQGCNKKEKKLSVKKIHGFNVLAIFQFINGLAWSHNIDKNLALRLIKSYFDMHKFRICFIGSGKFSV